MGRYLPYRLHPFTVGETRSPPSPGDVFKGTEKVTYPWADLVALGGFPSRCFAQAERMPQGGAGSDSSALSKRTCATLATCRISKPKNTSRAFARASGLTPLDELVTRGSRSGVRDGKKLDGSLRGALLLLPRQAVSGERYDVP